MTDHERQEAERQAQRDAYRRYCEAWWRANPEAVASVGERRGRARIVKQPLTYWLWLLIQLDGLSEPEWQAEVERMKAGTEVFRRDLRDPDCEAFGRRQAVAAFHARPPKFEAGNVVPIRPASRPPGQRGYAPWWWRG